MNPTRSTPARSGAGFEGAAAALVLFTGMTKPTFSECFAIVGATLVNAMQAISAQATDGAIVISCWSQYFCHPDKKALRCTDILSRQEGNAAGNKLLRKHLLLAQAGSLSIHLVVATAQNALALDQGLDASKLSKTCHLEPEVVRQLASFDRNAFMIDYRRSIRLELHRSIRWAAMLARLFA